jgi:hypothetical protein
VISLAPMAAAAPRGGLRPQPGARTEVWADAWIEAARSAPAESSSTSGEAGGAAAAPARRTAGLPATGGRRGPTEPAQGGPAARPGAPFASGASGAPSAPATRAGSTPPAAIRDRGRSDAGPPAVASPGDDLGRHGATRVVPDHASRALATPRPARSMPIVPPGAAHAATPPRASQDLLVEHLDVRIITEPPRAPAAPARIARAPSMVGAWRPSVRRFLGRP